MRNNPQTPEEIVYYKSVDNHGIPCNMDLMNNAHSNPKVIEHFAVLATADVKRYLSNPYWRVCAVTELCKRKRAGTL